MCVATNLLSTDKICVIAFPRNWQNYSTHGEVNQAELSSECMYAATPSSNYLVQIRLSVCLTHCYPTKLALSTRSDLLSQLLSHHSLLLELCNGSLEFFGTLLICTF